MKKLLLIGLLLPFFAFTVTDWVTINLDEKFSVDFPSEPQKQDMDGSPVWVADVDSTSRVMSLLFDFKKFGLDSAGLVREMSKPEALKDFRESFMAELGSAKLLSERSTTIQGYTVFEYMVEMGESDSPLIMYSKNIFVNTNMYSLSFYEKKSNPNSAGRDRFFKSVKIRKW